MRGRVGDRGRHREASLLAARERERVRLGEPVEPQRAEQLVDARGACRSPSLRARGPTSSSARTDAGEELVLGALEHRADARQQVARPPAPRARRAGRPRARHVGSSRPPSGGSSPASVSASVDLPTPFGPVTARTLPGVDAQVDAAQHGRCPGRARRRALDAVSSGCPERRAGARSAPRHLTGQPDARGAQLLGPGAEHVARARPSASRPPAAPSTTMRSTTGSQTDTRCSITTSVAPVSSATRRHGVAHLADAVGIEVRGRLVEQDDARPHREHAGQRESLPLPARQLRGRVIERQVESHGVERRAHPRPDLVARRRRGSRARTPRRRRAAPSPPARRDPAGRGRSGRATRRPDGRRPAARRSPPRRRRRRARPRARAAASTCPTPRRRAAAPVLPARMSRSRSRTAGVAPPAVAPAPAPRRHRRGARVDASRVGTSDRPELTSRGEPIERPGAGESAHREPRQAAGDHRTADDRRDRCR